MWRTSLALLIVVHTSVAIAANDLPARSENAALQYWQAFEFLSGDANNARGTKAGSPAIESLVNSSAIRFLHRGAMMASADWGLAYDQGMACQLPHLNKCSHLAQVGLLWARQASSKRQFDEAMETTADVIALGRHIAADPMISTLQIACEIQDDAGRQIINQLSITPKDSVAKLAVRLKTLPPLASVEEALGTQQLMVVQSSRIFATRRAASKEPDEEYPLQVQAGFESASSLYAELVRISQLPPDQWPAAEAEFANKLKKLPLSAGKFIDPRNIKHLHAIARSRVQFRLTEAAISIVLNGSDAAGKFSDPYSNTPIQYRAVDNGFELDSQTTIDGELIGLLVVISPPPNN